MPLNAMNQRNFMRHLYAGQLQTVKLFKRGDDQKEGTVVTHLLFGVRLSKIYKTGEPIQGDMSANHTMTLHIPFVELNRVGVQYINAGDFFEDAKGRKWVTLSPETTINKLFEVHLCVPVERYDDTVVSS